MARPHYSLLSDRSDLLLWYSRRYFRPSLAVGAAVGANTAELFHLAAQPTVHSAWSDFWLPLLSRQSPPQSL